MELGVIAALAVTSPLIALAVLTVLGERRRSRRWSVALLAGLFFPLAWTAWYVRDSKATRPAS